MKRKKIRFRIHRYKPGHIDPPRFQNFDVQVEPGMSILDCLEKIRLEQDQTLMYRHSCHHSSCGTCACRINDLESLACTTDTLSLNNETITLRPLAGFKSIGDLVVDMQGFYEDFSEDWSHLCNRESGVESRLPLGIQALQRFEDCIECAACVSACPVTRKNEAFVGPAVLAALHREVLKHPEKSGALMELAGGERGVIGCESALKCSHVCPSGVYPARHIADLRRQLAAASDESS